MLPFDDDPELAAIFRNLTGRTTAPPTGERPTPAHMPRRRQRPATASEIARAENLDLGEALRPKLQQRSPSRLQPRRESVFKQVLTYIGATGCSREEAARLTRQWLCLEDSLEGVRYWADAVGIRRPHVGRALAEHGLKAEDLDTRIDGTTALRRLRNDEPVGQVVAALLSRRNSAGGPNRPGRTG